MLTALAWLVPHGTAAVSAHVLCTPYNHAPCHFMQSHIRKVYACLAVTCHLHFWQNDRDLLRATVVTRGWKGHRNKSQHRYFSVIFLCVCCKNETSRLINRFAILRSSQSLFATVAVFKQEGKCPFERC